MTVKLDEHKVMIGFKNSEEAEAALRANYPAGWKIGKCTPMTVNQFKAWLSDGDTSKPIAKQVSAFDEDGEAPCAPFCESVQLSESGELYHGTPSGDLRGSHYGLHIGTRKAAEEALHARIGVPVHGTWDGTREYGKTLLAGREALTARNILHSGYNAKAPEHNHYVHEHPEGFPNFSDRTPVLSHHKPNIIRVKIVGKMSNSPSKPLGDSKANGVMKGQLKKGTAKKGYYYKNDSEDEESISAVVPHRSHIEQYGECCEPFVGQYEETEDLKRLREFIQRGTSQRIKTTIEQIQALKKLPFSDPRQLIGKIEMEIRALQPAIHGNLSAAMYGSNLQGMANEVARLKLPDLQTEAIIPTLGDLLLPGPPESIPTAEFPALADALKVLRNSPVASGVNYKHTADLVHKGSFAVTTDLGDHAVKQVHAIFADAIHAGVGRDVFIDRITERLGEGALSERHIENIFRTNAIAAFSDGQMRALQSPMVVDYFPYVAYWATRDARVRPEHKALETLGLQGTNIYRADDPTFKMFRPPWGYQCRCAWNSVTVEQAARRGVREAMDWLERAKVMASEKGGSFSQYFNAVAPATKEFVPPPPFVPPPEFLRTAL